MNVPNNLVYMVPHVLSWSIIIHVAVFQVTQVIIVKQVGQSVSYL